MPIELALYQPDIPQNTGTLLRLAACVGVRVHIIHPTGFTFSRNALKRSGLDYVEHADFVEHDDYGRFLTWISDSERRLVLLTTKASVSCYDARYERGDVLIVGRESSGVPQAVADDAALRVRIPMRAQMRSLNVAIAASLVLGEALRQTGGFESLT